MAKNISSNIKIQGKLGELVFVRSTVYGDHIRAARGTKKPAKLNKTLAANAGKTAALNDAARPVYGLIKDYCRFHGRQLWQEILSRMRRAKTMDPFDLLEQVKGLEIDSRYALERFLVKFEIEVKVYKQKLAVYFSEFKKPSFDINADCYFYELCILYFGDKRCMLSEPRQTEWITSNRYEHQSSRNPLNEYVIEFERPRGMQYYLLCLMVQGGRQEEIIESMEAVGMRIIGAGRMV